MALRKKPEKDLAGSWKPGVVSFMATRSPVKVYPDRRKNGKTYYSVRWTQGGQRHRVSYPTEAQANTFAAQKAEELASGLASPLSPKEIIVLTQLRDEVEQDTGILFADFVRDALARYRQTKPFDTYTLEEVFSEYQLAKSDRGDRHTADIKSRVGALVKKFKQETNLQSLTGDDIKDWIAQTQKNLRTRRNYFSSITAFLNWCTKKEYIAKNPLKKLDNFQGREEPKDQLIPASDFLKILETIRDSHTNHKEMVLLLALQSFAGVRRAESERLTWKDLEIVNGVIVSITVNKSKAKTKSRRNVTTSEAFRALTPIFPKQGKPDEKLTSYSKPNESIRQWLLDKHSLVIPENSLRHSFVTHTLKTTGDILRTALDAGHTPHQVETTYKGLSTLAEASAWFQIPHALVKNTE